MILPVINFELISIPLLQSLMAPLTQGYSQMLFFVSTNKMTKTRLDLQGSRQINIQ